METLPENQPPRKTFAIRALRINGLDREKYSRQIFLLQLILISTETQHTNAIPSCQLGIANVLLNFFHLTALNRRFERTLRKCERHSQSKTSTLTIPEHFRRLLQTQPIIREVIEKNTSKPYHLYGIEE